MVARDLLDVVYLTVRMDKVQGGGAAYAHHAQRAGQLERFGVLLHHLSRHRAHRAFQHVHDKGGFGLALGIKGKIFEFHLGGRAEFNDRPVRETQIQLGARLGAYRVAGVQFGVPLDPPMRGG